MLHGHALKACLTTLVAKAPKKIHRRGPRSNCDADHEAVSLAAFDDIRNLTINLHVF